MSTHKKLAKSAGVISAGILSSRILGFVRDIVIARLFGIAIYAQAFVIAFRIPNLLRDLVGEGATNAALVPVLSEYAVKQPREEFWKLVNTILVVLFLLLSAITVLGIIFSPQIVRLIAPGFTASAQKLQATITLNRIIFPYILLIALTAYAMGVLNSLHHFAVPAFAPCLLNISIIIFALLYGEGIKGLALGVLVGGVLQLAVHIPVLYQKGFRLKIPQRLKHPVLKEIRSLMAPRLVSSAIYQLNNFADSIFGSLAWIVGDGGVAVLYFSYRLIQFPLGVFSTALSQAILPTLSTQAATQSHSDLKRTLSWGLRAVSFVMLPASLAFMVLAKPLVTTLFGGGRFDLIAADKTAAALFFYSIGLFAYGGTRILQSCFFALKDTVTPTKNAALALAINVVLNAILMFPLKIAGLALATSISGIISFLVLFVILKKRLEDFEIARIGGSFLRIAGASLGMAAVCFVICRQNFSVNKYLILGLEVAAGVVSYVVFCFIFRVREMRELWEWVLKRK